VTFACERLSVNVSAFWKHPHRIRRVSQLSRKFPNCAKKNKKNPNLSLDLGTNQKGDEQ